ncbi:hypothetical protein [Streptomyces sp. NBC_00572]|uniref:hypothetical protein n=1 Tax=Streptomyces sp. NBC_00572 TaxID=2903664 RepID=UPI0022580B21|nr:hypothetical protein [Streptomyces sp. NBC_00572]MCX4986253.1 hypothetical protein [Streptomyces sp. NBC_00572]
MKQHRKATAVSVLAASVALLLPAGTPATAAVPAPGADRTALQQALDHRRRRRARSRGRGTGRARGVARQQRDRRPGQWTRRPRR